MSNASFFRKNVMDACEDGLDDIRHRRGVEVSKAIAEKSALEIEFGNRNWWDKTRSCNLRDRFAIVKLEERIRTAEDCGLDQEERIKVIFNFCESVLDDTVYMSAQEFSDFGSFYDRKFNG